MLPIFNEYITFLQSKTDQLDFLKEGYYWYDKSIIKAFDKNTNKLIKVARIYYDDNLDCTIKSYFYCVIQVLKPLRSLAFVLKNLINKLK